MRIDHYDYWKGLAIIAVVMIHSIGFTVSQNNFNTDIGIFLRQFVSFAVPVFFFISGYFSLPKKDIPYLSFVLDRCKRILPPYVLWSTIFLFLSVIFFNKDLNFENFFFGILFGTSIGIGYFVIVLMQYVLLTPYINKIKTKRNHIFIMSMMSVFGVFYTYNIKIFFSDSIISNFPFSGLPFFVWYPFYHFGFYLSKYKPSLKIGYNRILFIYFSLIILSILEAFSIKSFGYIGFASSQLKISSLLLSFLICFFIYQSINGEKRNKIIVSLGLNSYGIYLIHILFVNIGVKIISKTYFYDNYVLLSIIFITLFSLTFSFLVIKVTKIIFGKYSKYLVG